MYLQTLWKNTQMVPGDLLDMGLEPKRREPKRRATHVASLLFQKIHVQL